MFHSCAKEAGEFIEQNEPGDEQKLPEVGDACGSTVPDNYCRTGAQKFSR